MFLSQQVRRAFRLKLTHAGYGKILRDCATPGNWTNYAQRVCQ
jgi:hypothetical protein